MFTWLKNLYKSYKRRNDNRRRALCLKNKLDASRLAIISDIETAVLKRAEIIQQLELKPNKTAAEVAALNRLNYYHQLSLAKLHAVKSGKRSKQYDVDKFEAAADLVTERTRAPVTDEVKSLLKDIAGKSK